MIAVHLGLLLGGGVALYFGAEWLVRGAAGLARVLGVTPLVVGLTVVAYGTSMPELVVSAAAALGGRSAVALGNVVGSNIANLGLILGLTALVSPIQVVGKLVYRELPALVVTTALLPLTLAGDGVIGRLEGALLLAGAVVFTLWMARKPARPELERAAVVAEADAEAAGAPSAGESRLRLAGIAAAGLLLLVGGGKIFVDGAVGLALRLGMSERVVGLTVVAIGTSVPELAASLVAAARGHAAIAVGNVIGSNVFNVLFVLGGAAVLHPVTGGLGALRADLSVLGGVTLLGALLLRTERRMTRLEGGILVAAYAAFLGWLVMAGR